MCEIGHDVWIGHGAIILPGRNVGTGAVIAAGAIVTRDVPAYTIVAGNPAKIIRRRFDERTEERLKALGWWNWSHEALRSALPDFRKLGVEAFLDKYERVAFPRETWSMMTSIRNKPHAANSSSRKLDPYAVSSMVRLSGLQPREGMGPRLRGRPENVERSCQSQS